MPIHDWTLVAACVFHHFHHAWITEISRVLNNGFLPDDYYAMAELEAPAAGVGPDVMLRTFSPDRGTRHVSRDSPTAARTLTRPNARFTAQGDAEYYRRKKSCIAVRHVSDDRLIAMVEILSPGNKGARKAFQALLEEVCDLLENKIHLLILDLFPPSKRDPQGIHAAIWEEIVDEPMFTLPPGKPLTLAAYESDLVVKAFVENVAVGDCLPDMPLILEPDAGVNVPLEETYQRAYAAVPRRWQRVLEPA